MDEQSLEKTKVLYIIRSKENTLVAVESFLHNRNFEIQSSTNATTAYEEIKASQPDFVLISLNNPHPKILMFPQLLAQVINPDRIIIFADMLTAAVTKSLSQAKINKKYILYPPLSGPAVERMTLKILKDEDAAKRAADKPDTQRLSSSDSVTSGGFDNISIKGSSAVKDTVVISSGAFQNDNEIVSRTKGLTFFDSGSIREKRLVSEDLGETNTTGLGSQEELEASNSNTAAESWGSETSGKATKGTRSKINTGNKKQTGGSRLGETESDQSSKQARFKTSALSRSAPVDFSESLLIRGTEEAFEFATTVVQKAESETLAPAISNIACLIVESAKVSGYLIVAYGKDRQIDKEFIQNLRSKLVLYMRENGDKDFTSEQGLELTVEPTRFSDWALEQAEFLRKSIHKGNEVAIAFFPELATEIPLEISDHEKMLEIDIDNLVLDHEVDFDLYLHMPKNGKFIMHTRKSRVFSKERKSRLQAKDIQKLFVRTDSSENVRRYRVRTFLNQKIAALRGPEPTADGR